MLNTSNLRLSLCALALGIGGYFSTGAQAVAPNTCIRGCVAERVACLRAAPTAGDGSWCLFEFTLCTAGCQVDP